MRTSNFISVTGNLGSAVEIRKPDQGEDVAKLSVAETVSRMNAKTAEFEQVHTNWIPVVAFGTLAQRAAQALKKGDRVTVVGTLKTSSYEKDGESRRGFEVVAYSIEKAQFLSKADSSGPVGVKDSKTSGEKGEESGEARKPKRTKK
jgi:single-strand DNA-binding protein